MKTLTLKTPRLHTKHAKRTSNHQGFTIVELLIVIVIIGILAAISIVVYANVREKADTAAMQSELAQIQRKVQVGLAESGEATDIQTPIAYLNSRGTRTLTKSLTAAQEITMYAVFDTNGNTSASWQPVARLLPHNLTSNAFHIRTNSSGSTEMRLSYSTTALSDRSFQCTGNIRGTTGRHVAWISAGGGIIGAACDANTSSSTFTALSAHSGWTFNSVELTETPGAAGIAVLVFPEFHDEATRAQVLRWLDERHSIDFYS